MNPDPTPGEELILCPYEAAHSIRKSKMEHHLKKCRASHPTKNFATCHFNTTHVIPALELQYHHKFCPDRIDIERHCVLTSTTKKILPVQNAIVPNDDDWETAAVPTYNPMESNQNKSVLRVVNTEPPSVRKNFRCAERQRLADLESNENRYPNKRSDNKKNQTERLPPIPTFSADNIEQTPDGISKLLKTINVTAKVATIPNEKHDSKQQQI